jgi:hypothetical protein
MAVSRYEAEQGQTVRLGIRFELPTGDLYDPDSISQVEIMDASSVVIDTIPGTNVVKIAVGVYYVDWPIPLAETEGKHYDRWSYVPATGHTGTIAKQEFIVFAAGSFSVSAYYISVENAKARCLVGTSLSDSDVQYLIKLAMAIIDRCAGQHFLPQVRSIDVDGTGEGFLPLPQPLAELTGLSNLDDTSMTFTISDYRTKGTWLFHKDWKTGAAIPAQLACLDGGYFPRGHRNIRVTGTWGMYETCPIDIEHAACLLLRYAGQWDTLTGPIIENYSRESVDGWSYALREVFTKAIVNRSTGHPDVDVIIQNHRRTDRGMAVI